MTGVLQHTFPKTERETSTTIIQSSGSTVFDIAFENLADRNSGLDSFFAGQVVITMDDAGVHTRNEQNNDWSSRRAAKQEMLLSVKGNHFISNSTRIFVPNQVDLRDFGVKGGVRQVKIIEAISRTQFRIEGLTIDDLEKELYIHQGGRFLMREYDFYNWKSKIIGIVGDIATIESGVPEERMGSFANSLFFDERIAGVEDVIEVVYTDPSGEQFTEEFNGNSKSAGLKLLNDIQEVISFKINNTNADYTRLINNDNYKFADVAKYFNNYESTGDFNFSYPKTEITSRQYEITIYTDGFFDGVIGSVYNDANGNPFRIILSKSSGQVAVLVPEGAFVADLEPGSMTKLSGLGSITITPNGTIAKPLTMTAYSATPGVEGNGRSVFVFDDGSVAGNDAVVNYNSALDRIEINIDNGVTQRDAIRYKLQEMPEIFALELGANGIFYLQDPSGDTFVFSEGVNGDQSVGLKNKILSVGYANGVIGLDETDQINRAFRIAKRKTVMVTGEVKADRPVVFFPGTVIDGGGTFNFQYKVDKNNYEVGDGYSTNKPFVCIAKRTHLNQTAETRTLTDSWFGVATYGGTSEFLTRETFTGVTSVVIEDKLGNVRTVKPSAAADKNTVMGISSVNGFLQLEISGAHSYQVGEYVFVKQSNFAFVNDHYKITSVVGDFVTLEAPDTASMPADIGHSFYATSIDGDETSVRIPSGNHIPRAGEQIHISYTADNCSVISSEIKKGSQFVPMDNTAGIRSGDVIVLGDSNVGSYLSNRPSYKKGEAVTVKFVLEDGIRIVGTTYASYKANSVKAFLLDDSRGKATTLQNIEIKGYEESAYKGHLLMAHNLCGLTINNVKASKFRFKGIGIESCVGVAVDNVQIRQRQDDAPAIQREITRLHPFSGDSGDGTSYGLSIDSCQEVWVANSTLNGDRHSFDFGVASSYSHYVVNREILINNCNLESNYSNAIDGHGAMEFCRVSNCIVDGGMFIAGNHNSYTDITIRYGAADYRNPTSVVVFRELSGFDHEISNVTFLNQGDRDVEKNFFSIDLHNFYGDVEGEIRLNNLRFKDEMNTVTERTGKQVMFAVQHSGQELGIQNLNLSIENTDFTTLDGLNDGFRIIGGKTPETRIRHLKMRNCKVDKLRMSLKNIEYIDLFDVHISKVIGRGLEVSGGDQNTIIKLDKCSIKECTEEGLYIYGAAEKVKSLDIRNTEILNNSSDPLLIDLASGNALYPRNVLFRNVTDLSIYGSDIGVVNPDTITNISFTDVDKAVLQGMRYPGVLGQGFEIKDAIVIDKDKEKYILPSVMIEEDRTLIIPADSEDRPITETYLPRSPNGGTVVLPANPRDGKTVRGKVIELGAGKTVEILASNSRAWAADTLFYDQGDNYVWHAGNNFKIVSGDSVKVDLSGSRTLDEKFIAFNDGSVTLGALISGLEVALIISVDDILIVQNTKAGYYDFGDQWRVVETIGLGDGVMEPVGHSNKFPTGGDDRYLLHQTTGILAKIFRPNPAGTSANQAPTDISGSSFSDGTLVLKFDHKISIEGELSSIMTVQGQVREFVFDNPNSGGDPAWYKMIE